MGPTATPARPAAVVFRKSRRFKAVLFSPAARLIDGPPCVWPQEGLNLPTMGRSRGFRREYRDSGGGERRQLKNDSPLRGDRPPAPAPAAPERLSRLRRTRDPRIAVRQAGAPAWVFNRGNRRSVGALARQGTPQSRGEEARRPSSRRPRTTHCRD